MRSLAVAPLLLASASALPEIAISKRDRHNGGKTNVFARSVALEKRQGTVETNIFDVLSWSAGGAYYANITAGTPPQPQTVILDTGSSDLYFDASTAQTCKLPSTDPDSCQGGTYDKTNSRTYHETAASPAFNTTFGDGSTALGPYGSDVIGIGDVNVSPVQFGVAEQVDSTTGFAIGLLGLGYSTNEAVQSASDIYPNMPEVLREAGEINSRLYSIYLNDARSTSGTILFGGIDRSKFTGELATVDLIPAVYQGETYPVINQFITTITAANVSVGGSNEELWSGGSPGYEAYSRDDTALPSLLDTGSTAWSVPASYYRAILSYFSYVGRDGTTPCSNANSGDFISLEFGGKVTIRVDAGQFIVPLVNTTTREQVSYGNGQDVCLFLIQPMQDDGTGFGIAGDALLRSMYIVFDLDQGQASIAQAKLNSTDSPDIVTVAAGPTGVAAAVSGVNTAPANTWSISPEVTTESISYAASTAATAVGTATGEAAVPQSAQTEGDGSGGSDSRSGSAASSSGAASGIVMGKADLTPFYVAAAWVGCIALGFGVMM